MLNHDEKEYRQGGEHEDVSFGVDEQSTPEPTQDYNPEVHERVGDELEQPQVVEDEDKDKKHRINLGSRLSEVQREKYRLAEELRQTQEELNHARALADASTRTAMQHYDQAVMQRLQAAKEQKLKALESGDINAQTEADVALSLATSEYQNLANLKAQEQVYQQPHYQQQTPQYQDNTPVVQDWIAENSWFHPSSEDYDADLAGEVHAYCNAFDNNLYRAGLGHQIMSPEYFQVLNQHINSIRNQNNTHKNGELRMRSSRGNVSPVRNGYNQGSSGGQHQIKLNPAERELARRLGVDERTYLQHKLSDERKHYPRYGR